MEQILNMIVNIGPFYLIKSMTFFNLQNFNMFPDLFNGARVVLSFNYFFHWFFVILFVYASIQIHTTSLTSSFRNAKSSGIETIAGTETENCNDSQRCK